MSPPGVVICHLRPVLVLTVTHAVQLVLGLRLSLSASVLSLAFVISCVDLILAFHSAWSRKVIRLFKIRQYLPDVSLVCLDCDAVATQLDDTIQDSSALLKVCIFLNHLFLDLISSSNHFDEEFHHRSFSTDRDVVPVHHCHDVYALDTAMPHTRARAPSRQLEIAECRCKLFLQTVLQQPAHVFVLAAVRRTLFFVLQRRNTPFARRPVPQPSSTFIRGDLRKHNLQRLQRRRRRVFLRDPPCAHVGLPWLFPVSLCPSCLDGRLPRLMCARLSGDSRVQLEATDVLRFFTSCLGLSPGSSHPMILPTISSCT